MVDIQRGTSSNSANMTTTTSGLMMIITIMMMIYLAIWAVVPLVVGAAQGATEGGQGIACPADTKVPGSSGRWLLRVCCNMVWHGFE